MSMVVKILTCSQRVLIALSALQTWDLHCLNCPKKLLPLKETLEYYDFRKWCFDSSWATNNQHTPWNASSFTRLPRDKGKSGNIHITAETGNRTQAAEATTRSPATRLFWRKCIWRIRVSIPVLNLAKVVCYHVQQSPMCVHRDSNPNLILGRDKYYPCTMDARIVWTQRLIRLNAPKPP